MGGDDGFERVGLAGAGPSRRPAGRTRPNRTLPAPSPAARPTARPVAAITASTTSRPNDGRRSARLGRRRRGVALRGRRGPGRCRASGSPNAPTSDWRATVQPGSSDCAAGVSVVTRSADVCARFHPSGGFGQVGRRAGPGRCVKNRSAISSISAAVADAPTADASASMHIGAAERRGPLRQAMRAGQRVEATLRPTPAPGTAGRSRPKHAATSLGPEADLGGLVAPAFARASRGRRRSPWPGGSPTSRPAPLGGAVRGLGEHLGDLGSPFREHVDHRARARRRTSAWPFTTGVNCTPSRSPSRWRRCAWYR